MSVFSNNINIKSLLDDYKTSSEAQSAINNQKRSEVPVVVKPGKTLPAPLNLTGLINDNSVILKWGLVAGAKTYKVERSLNADFGTKIVVYNDKGNAFTDTDLIPGTQYYYRVSCVASGYVGEYAYFSGVTIFKFDTSELTVSSIGEAVLTLTWDGVTNATGYVVEKATVSNFSVKTTIYTGALLTYAVTGLSPLTLYYFRVYPTGDGHNVKVYATASATTKALLAAPGSFVSSAITSSGATLTWGTVTNATGYVVERATNVGFTTGLTTVYTGSALTTPVTGLSAATQYYFRVHPTATGSTTINYATLNLTTTS